MKDTTVNDPRARAFGEALQRFEQESDVAVLTELFADDATLLRLDARGDRTDAAAFWKEYREQFDEIATTFSNVVEGDDQFALEWTSKATLRGGRPIEYRGVTCIDLEGDKIVRLRTYYDSAQFTLVPAETD